MALLPFTSRLVQVSSSCIRRTSTYNSNQFGFKKGSGCDHAIYSVRKVVEHFVAGGSTVNVCLLDLSKAFNKMDHSALYLKLMDRSIPVQILSV